MSQEIVPCLRDCLPRCKFGTATEIKSLTFRRVLRLSEPPRIPPLLRSSIVESHCSDFSFIRKSHTRLWERRFLRTFSTGPAVARLIGQWVHLSSRLARKFATKSATLKSCWASLEALTPPLPLP